MNSAAKLEITVLAGAFVLGILGDALLRSLPWGINFTLWGSLLAAAIIYLARARRQMFADGGRWLLLPMVLCPLAFVWRDSPSLGLRIVDVLRGQLDGTVDQNSGPGTSFCLKFEKIASRLEQRLPPQSETRIGNRTLVSSAS